MSKSDMNDICVVCGDKGIGRNYGAISCAPCRSFFSRVVPQNKQYDCPWNGRCDITVGTRRKCQKCRLDKCIAMGMKIELLKSEEEKQYLKNIIHSNRLKRKFTECKTTDHTTVHVTDNTPVDAIPVQMQRKSVIIENKCSRYEANNDCAIVAEKLPVPRLLSDYEGFNIMERHRVSELSQASTIFDYPRSNNIVEIYSLEELYQYTSLTFDRDLANLVTYGNNLNIFYDMCDHDKLTLIKYGYFDLLNIFATKYFKIYPNYWIIYLDEDTTFIIRSKLMKVEYKRLFSHSPKLTKYIELYEHFESIWYALDLDSIAIDFACAIRMFNPNNELLLHSEYVKLQQQLYIYLLKRYLQTKYGSDFEAREKLATIMKVLTELNILRQLLVNEKDFRVFQQKFSHTYGELQREIELN